MEEATLTNQVCGLLIPKEILDSFTIEQIKEGEEIIEIFLLEKELIPIALTGKEAVLNGYMNPIELHNYPLQGKTCYLKLKRRRWKIKGTSNSTNCHNEYDFAAEGTKATKAFGAFLKENNLQIPI